tara:strand:+ start:214 stop:1182 length:969 start_codon:yes stop_codon:yes gene_type:complete
MDNIFDEVDVNGDGLISQSELKKYFVKKDLDIWGGNTEFKSLWRDADRDGDAKIDLKEFRIVMARASRRSSGVNSKWTELVDIIKAESGTSLQVCLYKSLRSYSHVMVCSKPIVGNSKSTIQTSFPAHWFEVGQSYFFTLSKCGTNNTELCRTDTFKCIDSDAASRAYVNAQIRRAAIAEKNRQARLDELRQLSVESHDALAAKINARRSKAKRKFKSAPTSRRANVVIDNVFHDIDANRNGTISMVEFKNHCRSIGSVSLSTSEMNLMFRDADASGDAKIDLTEFRKAMNLAKNKAASSGWNQLYSSYERQVGSKRSRYRR